ncbi:MAG TPA: amidohydrolase family protein [Geminicoccaceae bacterium]|nr:amidohydrolase family protein [Geminicoccaceae bacterium]
MSTRHLDGRILTPDGWRTGRLTFGETIADLAPRAAAPAERWILPGFVDLHVHGGGGADCMAGAAAVRAMTRFHARHGTTSLLATTVTAPEDELRRALGAIGAVAARPLPGEARVRGAHLEGPFISPDALGAQPPFAIPPDLALVDELCGLAPVRVATIAPEIDPDHALLRRLHRHGVRVQLGHSCASCEQAGAALAAGAAGFTHLFNAMTGMHHRVPGMVGAALAEASHAEIILDFQHVAPAAAQAALRAIPGLYGITDAVAAAGMPDGDYLLGRHRVIKRGDAVRLEDGTLAGSVLTMDRALRNFVTLGLDLAAAAGRLSTVPAAYLGLEDCGRIAPGARADLVVVEEDLRLCAVYVEGEAIDLADG